MALLPGRDDTADAFGVVAHERLSEVGAIGSPVDIPRGKAEHLAEVGEISGTFGRIVGAKVGTGGGELLVANFRCRQMGALGCLGIKAESEKLSVEVVDSRAGKRRLREHGAALAHDHDVPVADEIGSDEPVDLQGCYVARPAGQIDNGIGPLLREARRILRDHEPNCATGRPAAIFRYDEVAATRFGQLVGPRQFRARRGLEARHWWRTGILGVCQAGQGDEKANQEKVLVSDGHLAVPSLWSKRPPDDSGSIGRDWQQSIAQRRPRASN